MKYLLILCLLLSGCATPKCVSIEQPNGFVEVCEGKTRTYTLITCEEKWVDYADYSQAELVCTETPVQGTAEIDKEVDEYWGWNGYFD